MLESRGSIDESVLDGVERQKWRAWVLEGIALVREPGGRMVGRMKIGRTRRALDGTIAGGWARRHGGTEARKTVADRVKAEGGALRVRKTP